MKYRPKHLIEYGLVLAFSGFMNAIPYRVALGLGWCAAWLAFNVFRHRRTEVARRIHEVFGPDLPAREVRRIAWQSLRNFFFTAVEATRTPSLTLPWLYTVVDGPAVEAALAPLKERSTHGQGAVLACPHYGWWEMSGPALALYGVPVVTIAGKQRNPLFNAYLNKVRAATGLEVLIRGTSSLRTILSGLRRGRVFAVLPDVRMPKPGVRVRFLGKEANVGPGMAKFARHANVPIYTVILTRQDWTRHSARLSPPVLPDPSADPNQDQIRMTQEVFQIVEAAIRADPGQWFWYNRRWILDPVSA
jgi:Kdo2-lipid IVA lauroyltransferase/acyltransferase